MNCCSNIIRCFNTSHITAGEVAWEVTTHLRPVTCCENCVNSWFQLHPKKVFGSGGTNGNWFLGTCVSRVIPDVGSLRSNKSWPLSLTFLLVSCKSPLPIFFSLFLKENFRTSSWNAPKWSVGSWLTDMSREPGCLAMMLKAYLLS